MIITQKMKTSGSAGFTLVELAFVMIISGLMMVTVFSGLEYYLKQHAWDKTIDNLQKTEDQLIKFRSTAGIARYPCPADPTLKVGDANYGVENCALPSIAGARDTNDADVLPDPILIGAVPFVTIQKELGDQAKLDPELVRLNISNGPEGITDGWGYKLTYAVTKSQTVAATFKTDRGAIGVIDEYNNSLTENVPASTHFVIISHGENGSGAYTSSGVIARACGVDAAGTITENENCDNDCVFLSGLRSTNAAYNDDVVKFISVQRDNLWVIANMTDLKDDAGNFILKNGQAIQIPQIVNTNPGNVGVGVMNPSEKLTVLGPVETRRFIVNNACDQNGDNCLPIDTIGGDDPDMKCDPGEAIQKIGRTCINTKSTSNCKPEVVCAKPFPAKLPAYNCPLNTYVTEIKNDGTVICN